MSIALVLILLAASSIAGELPVPKVSVLEKGTWRYVNANGLPAHATGDFPNPDNPNRIEAQAYEFRMPLRPVLGKARPCEGQAWGVASNGVAFDPGTDEFLNGDRQSGWRYDVFGPTVRMGLDSSRAHVQPGGAYHYHGLPQGLIDSLGGGEAMHLLGWAADGFPVYGLYAHKQAAAPRSDLRKMRSSYRLKAGKRPSKAGGNHDGDFVQDFEYVPGLGDLDECNGRSGVTPEHPQGTYYYVITETYPFIPRCWRGKPDPSFRRPAPPAGAAPQDRRPRRARQLGGGPL